MKNTSETETLVLLLGERAGIPHEVADRDGQHAEREEHPAGGPGRPRQQHAREDDRDGGELDAKIAERLSRGAQERQEVEDDPAHPREDDQQTGMGSETACPLVPQWRSDASQ